MRDTERERGTIASMSQRAKEILEDLIDDYRYDFEDVEDVEDTLREDLADGWIAVVNGLRDAEVEVPVDDVERLRAAAEMLEIDDDRLESF
jgi:hypothetical protein